MAREAKIVEGGRGSAGGVTVTIISIDC